MGSTAKARLSKVTGHYTTRKPAVGPSAVFRFLTKMVEARGTYPRRRPCSALKSKALPSHSDTRLAV